MRAPASSSRPEAVSVRHFLAGVANIGSNAADDPFHDHLGNRVIVEQQPRHDNGIRATPPAAGMRGQAPSSAAVISAVVLLTRTLRPVWPLGLCRSEIGGQRQNKIFEAVVTATQTSTEKIHETAARVAPLRAATRRSSLPKATAPRRCRTPSARRAKCLLSSPAGNVSLLGRRLAAQQISGSEITRHRYHIPRLTLDLQMRETWPITATPEPTTALLRKVPRRVL
jgi:hypothetical protein